MRKIQPLSSAPGEHSWLTAFQKDLVHQDLAALTVRGYRADVADFLRWYRSAALDRLTAVDLLHYRQHLTKDRNAKPATVNRKLEALRRFSRWAHAHGKLPAHVAAEVKLTHAVRGQCPKGLNAAEVQALLRTAGQSRHGLARRNYALTQVLLQTGLRVSEVARLQIGDLTLHERSGEVRVHGDGAKERTVPLNTIARRAIQAYMNGRDPLSPRAPVFLSETRAGISVRSIQAVVAELARRAKITRLSVSAQSCRHTFALSFLKQHPGKLIELAALLGHDSVETTAIYTKPAEEIAEAWSEAR